MEHIDTALVKQAAQGDMAAFEELYKKTSGYIYSLALRMIRNPEDAQDAAQEIFIKVYRYLKTFNFKSSFNTWIYRIAVNTVINTAKKTSRVTGKQTVLDETIAAEQVPNSIENTRERHDTHNQLLKILSVLNPDQRACIILREIDGLSYQDIARVLKTNINTVRTRLKRARQTLFAYGKKEVELYEMR